MIWASLLGVTNKVYKEFQKLYPNYESESHFKESSVKTATGFSSVAYDSVHPNSTSSGSGGSGGSSSRGGGGGSFGGGRGGGTR